jgi:hypothetical protein
MENGAFAGIVLLFVFITAGLAAAADTSVTVRPGYLNAAKFRPVTGKIYIDSAVPGEYGISITGVPAEWIDYPRSVHVEEKKTVTYIVSPKSTGKYTLSMVVEGPEETFDFETRLWVGPPGALQAGPYEASDEDASLEGAATGMFVLSEQDSALALYATVMALAVFAVLLGHFMLKEEEGSLY